MDDREIDARIARAAAAVPVDEARLQARVAAGLRARQGRAGWLSIPALPGARLAVPAFALVLAALPFAVAGWPGSDARLAEAAAALATGEAVLLLADLRGGLW